MIFQHLLPTTSKAPPEYVQNTKNIKNYFHSLIFVHQMILKSVVRGDNHFSPGDPKRHEEPEEMVNDTDLPSMSITEKISSSTANNLIT